MRIIQKDKVGFWFLIRYSFYLEDECEGITEMVVNKDTWEKFKVGDYYDVLTEQFYITEK